MYDAYWNGVFDVRWEGAPLGQEALRLVLSLRKRGYAERTCRDYGHTVIHLGRVLVEGGAGGSRTTRSSSASSATICLSVVVIAASKRDAGVRRPEGASRISSQCFGRKVRSLSSGPTSRRSAT